MFCIVIGGLLPGCFAIRAQTPAAVAAELRGIEQDLNPYTVLEHERNLPYAWTAKTPDGEYSISSAPLRALLETRSKSGSPLSAVRPARLWLETRAAELDSYADTITSGDPRFVLRRILAQKEFAPPAPPSAWARIRQRINQWVAQLIERLFGRVSKYPITGTLVFWAALAGAAGLLAYWLITLLDRSSPGLKLERTQSVIEAYSSDQWFAAFNAAKQRGDLRTAIQCAYWAGIERLQQKGDLPEKAVSTPREYLQLLPVGRSAVSGALRNLTVSMERFWYGFAEVTPGDLSGCTESLKDLGCRWD